MRSKNLLPLVPCLCLLLTACGYGHMGLEEGASIPSFQLPTLDGEELASESLRGEVVVLNFWATWCGPCVKEVPALEAIHASGAARVVAISLDDQGAKKVRPFVDRHGIGYTVLLGHQEVFSRYGGRAIPYTLVLDRDLNVFRSYLGVVRKSTLEKDVRRAAKLS